MTDTDRPPAVADPEYQHPRCYANTRGGCSTKISGEHYISHGLLKLYTFDDPDVLIQPSPNYRIPVEIKPKKFVANVLCENHNRGLSDADNVALQFATFLRDIALRFRNGDGEWGDRETIELSGSEFQRWLLKLLITHAAADVYTTDGGAPVTTMVAGEAIDLLLDRVGWPQTWGLGVTGDLTNPHLRFDPFSKSSTVIDDWWSVQPFIKHEPRFLFGGVVELAGVSFTLCVFNQSEALQHNVPENPLHNVLQRPSALTWELDGVPKTVQFSWDDPWSHRPITFTMSR